MLVADGNARIASFFLIELLFRRQSVKSTEAIKKRVPPCREARQRWPSTEASSRERRKVHLAILILILINTN
jgi:hypothetical protein